MDPQDGKSCRTHGKHCNNCGYSGRPTKGAESERLQVFKIHMDCNQSTPFLLQSFHAELHQFKHQIELFNSLTQKLIAVYPSDDTSRIKRMTESVNNRFVPGIFGDYKKGSIINWDNVSRTGTTI